MKKSICRTLVAAVSCGLWTAPAMVSAQTGYGQSFTAPSAPNVLLTGLSLAGLSGLGNVNPFRAQIFVFDGSSVIGGSLFTQNLGPSFSGFSLKPILEVVPGGRYVVLATAPFDFTSRGATVDASFYAGGGALSCNDGLCSAAVNPGDDIRGFTVQFLVTPEPETWLLCASGLLAVAMVARRRTQNR